MTRHITLPRSQGGNVFLDLGFPPEEAERLALHVDLEVALIQFLRRRVARALLGRQYELAEHAVVDTMEPARWRRMSWFPRKPPPRRGEDAKAVAAPIRERGTALEGLREETFLLPSRSRAASGDFLPTRPTTYLSRHPMQLFLTALDRLAAGPDTLHDAASLRAFAVTHGDYLRYASEEPQRLGVSDGVPFFLDDEGHYDSDINRFLRNLPVLGAKSPKTWLAYASDIALWARFLREVCSKHLWEASQSDINAYYRVRRITDGDLKVGASTWNRGVAALDKLYQWAYREKLVEALPFTYKTASRIRVPGYDAPISVQRNLARERGAPEGDLKYVSLEQYLVFRDVGLRGLTGVHGPVDSSFKGRQSERNAAYADLLITTGLRREEGGSFLAREVPDLHRLVLVPGQKSVPFQMPAARCKGTKSRKVFLPLRVIHSLQAYTEFERLAAVDKGRKRGRYATVKKPLLVCPNGTNAYTVVETGGRLRFMRIGADAVGRILERDDEDALSPGQLFLGETGLPLGVDSWNRVFQDASKRCQRLGYGIQVSPHTLRHTFAVNMLTLLIRSAIGSLHAEDLKSASRRSYLRLIGDPLQRLQRMLGHSSITSTYIYLDTLDAAQEIVHEAVERWSAELDASRYIGEGA